MKAVLAILFATALPAAAVIAAPSPADATAAPLGAVSAHLKALDTMTADFSQTGANGQMLTGKLTLARPGRIRFQYEPGVPILVVADGSALTFIDYKVRQVSRWPIKSTPLGVLLDPSRDPTRYARLLPSQGNEILVEAKDPKHPEYGIITLAFERAANAPAGLTLTGWTVVDAQNARTTVRLANQRYGVPVDKATFKFKDPRPRSAPGRS